MFGDTVEFEVKVVANTGRALLCLVYEIDEELWIPTSQIVAGGDVDADSSPGAKGSLIMTQWIAKQKGLL